MNEENKELLRMIKEFELDLANFSNYFSENISTPITKENIENFLETLKTLGVDTSKFEEYFNSFFSKTIHTSKEIIEFRYIYKNLKNKYKNYIELQEVFEQLALFIDNKKNLSFIDINELIPSLEKVKNDALFITSECLQFINFVYITIYEYMKLEILTYDKYSIYNYILNNPHDYWYINLIMKTEIEELTNSLNYILGVKELQERINKNLKDENYLNLEILKALIRVNYKEKSLTIVFEEYYKLCGELEELNEYIKIARKQTYTGLLSPIEASILRKKLNKITIKSLEFIDEKGFLFTNEYQEYINKLNLRIYNAQSTLEYYTPTKKRKKL